MEIPPPHVLAQLDAIIVGQSRAANDGGGSDSGGTDEGGSPAPEDDETAPYDHSGDLILEGNGGARTSSSRFWGVCWDKCRRCWQARYLDANGKRRHVGYFATEEAAAHAVNAAIRRAGLEGKRNTNPVIDGQLVPKKRKANGHGPPRKSQKRRRDEPATAAGKWNEHDDERERKKEEYRTKIQARIAEIERENAEREAAERAAAAAPLTRPRN